MKLSLLVFFLLTGAALVTACDQRMAEQPRYNAYEPSEFFADGASARPLPQGVIPYASNPRPSKEEIPLTADLMSRGRERYGIFCTPCHGIDGYGQGIAVTRGFPAPPSFHSDRLRAVPDDHVFRVITSGFGVMYGYGDRIASRDRWAIVAYVRALQGSQNTRAADLKPEERDLLNVVPFKGERP